MLVAAPLDIPSLLCHPSSTGGSFGLGRWRRQTGWGLRATHLCSPLSLAWGFWVLPHCGWELADLLLLMRGERGAGRAGTHGVQSAAS